MHSDGITACLITYFGKSLGIQKADLQPKGSSRLGCQTACRTSPGYDEVIHRFFPSIGFVFLIIYPSNSIGFFSLKEPFQL
jgi:hypothetical protein